MQSNIELVITDEKIQTRIVADKNILSENFPYFKAMFMYTEGHADYVCLRTQNVQVTHDLIVSCGNTSHKFQDKTWDYIFDLYKCRNFFGLEFIPLVDKTVPPEYIDELIDTMEIIGYDYSTIKYIAHNLPKNYALNKLSVELLKSIQQILSEFYFLVENRNGISIFDGVSKMCSKLFDFDSMEQTPYCYLNQTNCLVVLDNNNILKIFDTQTLNVVTTSSENCFCNSIIHLESKNWIVGINSEGFEIYDANNLKLIGKINTVKQFEYAETSLIGKSSDDKYIVFQQVVERDYGYNYQLMIASVETGEIIGPIYNDNRVFSCICSPILNVIVYGNYNNFTLWSLDSRSIVAEFKLDVTPFKFVFVDFSLDGSYIIFVDSNAIVYIWSIVTKQFIRSDFTITPQNSMYTTYASNSYRQFNKEKFGFYNISILPNNNLVSTKGNCVSVWNIMYQEPIESFDLPIDLSGSKIKVVLNKYELVNRIRNFFNS
ncbi:putative BTB/POZ domain-containing protein [Acanthamoeba polyphaga mimivirus]|uniref:BTB/POZ domain-containing protein n=1 Tax=Acanthamoeba polyphaga mimivirus Kroon TaxID=3069720 RepID=A0A0G2Y9K8_9VIRU|nr:putative BTB/POZ domain-containing protein [Acanthamoeba polyphaga mimivirus]AKI80507.1 putative BTB/POZ domain-containing protein [Acanthamoeba polyphaga mimivirus Kroon]